VIVRAHEDLQQLRVERHDDLPSPVPRISARRSSVSRASSSGVVASTFSRSNGSVLDGRTLHHQSSNSTVSPSSRSCRPSRSAAATSSILPLGSSTRELISPEETYRRKGARSSESGAPYADSSPRAITAAIRPESALKLSRK
jgi:hypothetical protein